jgi:SOS regulatory protein LexA
MNNRDDQYLAKLQDYYAENGVVPSFAVIAGLVGLKSTSAVSAMVDRLKASGHLASTPEKRLQPGARFFERVVADTIRAGVPMPANDVRTDVVSIDRHLIEKPSHTVLLSVRGDSMMEAGLLNGDTIVVIKGAPTKVGDIVVAIVDNEFTVKFLAKDKRGFYLEAGNKDFQPIQATHQLEIYGLVTGSFRRYE